jgi:hypothetical protein
MPIIWSDEFITAADPGYRAARPEGRHGITRKYDRHPDDRVAFGMNDPIVYVAPHNTWFYHEISSATWVRMAR